MELEAVQIAKARADALRDALRELLRAAQVGDDVVTIDRRAYNQALAVLTDDSRYSR